MAPKRSDVVAEELRELADNLRDVVNALTHDPKEQARKERRWRLLYGALTTVATVGARRIATRVWPVLTGERPPTKR